MRHHRLRPLLPALFGALILLPSAARQEDGPGAGDTETVGVELKLVPEPTLSIAVTIECPGAPDGSSLFEVSDEWGGVTAGGEDLQLLQARGRDGRPLESTRPSPHQWNVVHAADEPLRVSFSIGANAHQAARDPATHRRPIVNEHLFHTIGTLALPFPDHLDTAAERTVRLSWADFAENGWETMCSFGAGPGPHSPRTSIERVWNALYAAGELRVHQRTFYERPLWISLAGDDWGFTDEAFVDVASDIVFFERAFFQDADKPFYWISAIGVGAPGARGSSMGGTGLTDSFSLMMDPDANLEIPSGMQQSVQRLLAHEMFHEWNGRVIQRVQPEEGVYWFSEGFTNFYARRLVYRGGWIDRARYAEIVNAALEALWSSPVREAPNARIAEEFWSSAEMKDLPYLRGDVVAMIVDHGIRAATGGMIDLDHVMRELVQEGREGALIDTESLLGKFAQYLGEEATEALRAVVVDGMMPELPPDLFSPCFELEHAELPTFELGFDLEASQTARTVRGVREGSAAHAAGLRDGQTLSGWSVYHGDTEREVVLQIGENARELRYLPHGATRSVPQFRVPEGAPSDAESTCPVL